MTITIITTEGTVTLSADRWTRDEGNDVYVYDDDNGEDPVATIDSKQFVAAYRTGALLTERD